MPFGGKGPVVLLRWIIVAALGLYLAGFVVFVTSLPKDPGDLKNVQGIVALTGGEMRIDAANRLFERGIGKRLLISGVHPNTSKEKLKAIVHGGKRFDCCVDLGYAAENTQGNAREAAKWARFYHYKTILIVTARYHMPRSLSEFHEAMPGTTILPHPIDPESIPKGWWYNWRALRVLHGEYAKYLAAAALAAVGLEPKNLDRSEARG
jgi:uncharacterized SAM-binding protein YcdF (DUF218 family)